MFWVPRKHNRYSVSKRYRMRLSLPAIRWSKQRYSRPKKISSEMLYKQLEGGVLVECGKRPPLYIFFWDPSLPGCLLGTENIVGGRGCGSDLWFKKQQLGHLILVLVFKKSQIIVIYNPQQDAKLCPSWKTVVPFIHLVLCPLIKTQIFGAKTKFLFKKQF